MKYLLSSFMFLGLFFSFAFAFTVEDDCEERTFIVTAYYSPLSGQTFYYKPTYQDEVTLNGQGVAGAGGKKVFNGMLAAPASYNFGDVVVFPSLGIGEVADRGGAIVEDGERGNAHDRIDVWMGKGEEGLVRALTFGKKTLTGYYCAKDVPGISHLKIGINFSSVPVLKYFFDVALFIQELTPERTDVWVYTLQKYLAKLGYLSDKKLSGYFGSETKKALCNYQIKKGIASKKTCGTFGKTTRYKMKLDVENKGLFPSDLWSTSSITSLKDLAKTYLTKQGNTPIVSSGKKTFFTIAFRKNDQDEKIKVLQTLLQKIGLYSGSLNGKYTVATLDAVYAFQIKKGILKKGENSQAEGWLGPSTRVALNDLYFASGSLITSSGTVAPVVSVSKSNFQFYRPYKKGDKNAEVKILQMFLQKQGLYSGSLDSVYSQMVVNAVYDFQLKYSILTEKSAISLRGYLGPSTRKKINAMIE